MHTLSDVHRSLRRWAWHATSFPRQVYLTREELVGKERPFAYVEPNGNPAPMGTSRSSRFRGNTYDTQREHVISAYPAVGDTPRESRMIAEELVTRFYQAVIIGLVMPPEVDGNPPTPLGGPLRIPLYDFADVALGAQGPTDPYDHAWVGKDFNIRSIGDEDDPKLFTVALTMTLSWRSPGAIPLDEPGAPVTSAIPGTFDPPED